MRTKESDCRIKGFVIEISDDVKDKVKVLERGGMGFDLILGVGIKNDFLDEWGYLLRSCWTGVNKVWIEEQSSDSLSTLMERMLNQLYYVTE